MKNCKYCDREFATKSGCGVHEVQCKSNPTSRNIQQGRQAWNAGMVGDPRCSRAGIISTYTVSEEHKKRLSEFAKSRGFGGYNPNAGHSKKFKVIDSFGKETTLQSTYELECAELLNKMNIKWNRPKAMKYSGRNYFADFYLPDFEVYLDPKNAYKAKLDADKIALVIVENKVKLFVLLKEQITEEYIGLLIQR